MSQNQEYLLSDENNRLTVYPIHNKNMAIWEMYKKQQVLLDC